MTTTIEQALKNRTASVAAQLQNPEVAQLYSVAEVERLVARAVSRAGRSSEARSAEVKSARQGVANAKARIARGVYTHETEEHPELAAVWDDLAARVILDVLGEDAAGVSR